MIGDAGLYVWGSYVMGVALALTEIVLVRLRDKAIRGHLGWFRGYRQPAAKPEAGPKASGQDGTT